MLDKISTLQGIYNLAVSKYEDNKRRALIRGRPLRYLFNKDFYSVLDYDLGKIAKIILSVVHWPFQFIQIIDVPTVGQC